MRSESLRRGSSRQVLYGVAVKLMFTGALAAGAGLAVGAVESSSGSNPAERDALEVAATGVAALGLGAVGVIAFSEPLAEEVNYRVTSGQNEENRVN